jgi:predicted transcriptional regulator
MNTVKELMAHKQSLAGDSDSAHWHVMPHDTVATAIQRMSEYNLGAVLVLENHEIVGIFSERDYARKIMLMGKSSLTTPVFSVMAVNVIYVTPNYTLDECLAIMTNKHFRHLPVIENGKLVSLISIEDVAAALIEGKEFMIAELTKYITGAFHFQSKPALPPVVNELVWHKPSRGELLQ